MKHKVTKVQTGYSEKLDLKEKTFGSIAQFDIFVIMAYADNYGSNYIGYYKTYVTITFEDGFVYELRFDAEPVKTLVGHFTSLRQYYIDGDKPEWVNWKDWQHNKEEYVNFFANYKI
jgi:hypothetical protein